MEEEEVESIGGGNNGDSKPAYVGNRSVSALCHVVAGRWACNLNKRDNMMRNRQKNMLFDS